MTEREKMIEIVLDTEITGIKLRNITGGMSTANAIADALIAANIGDVTEWKERAEKAEKERDEYRKSTHIALRGIEILKRNILRYFVTEFPNILQQAEREIEEEGKDE